MSATDSNSRRRVPTLVSLCQRVASNSVASISTLGDDLRYDLVKPILERSDIQHLLRLENASPYLRKNTEEIWQALCFRKYPEIVDPFHEGRVPEPESWRDHYYVLKEQKAKRLAEIGSRLRTHRIEADERKREREIKLTDRIPSVRHPRNGFAPPPPKTLFQKTRTEASRLQKNIYTARVVPPMPKVKGYNVAKPPSADLLPSPPPSSTTRVSVRTVIQRRPPSTSSSTSGLSSSADSAGSPSSTAASSPETPPLILRRSDSTVPCLNSSYSVSIPPQSSPEKPPISQPILTKKDPMATMFLPKHRAYSQRVR